MILTTKGLVNKTLNNKHLFILQCYTLSTIDHLYVICAILKQIIDRMKTMILKPCILQKSKEKIFNKQTNKYSFYGFCHNLNLILDYPRLSHFYFWKHFEFEFVSLDNRRRQFYFFQRGFHVCILGLTLSFGH